MAKIFRYSLLILMCVIGSGRIMLVAQSDASEAAARSIWYEKVGPAMGSSVFHFDRITHRGVLTVFEKYQPASFIILKSTQAGYDLVGYSTRNLFFGSMGSSGEGVDVQPQILDALASESVIHDGRLKGGQSSGKSIGPLIQSQWGQGEYYNYYCPRDSRGPNGRTYVGCVAVAVGQVLRYYGRYNAMNFQYTYDSGYYGKLTAQIGPYNWAAMENNPIAVNLETCDLLSDLGILLQMTYGPSGSSTNSHRTLEAFHEMGYTEGVILRKAKFSNESWTEVFYDNLSDYKPILVTGGGHAFICDGYNEDGLFHFNLGWEGYGDGFYPLNCVMTLPVTEAFTELQPISWPHPPDAIGLNKSGNETLVSWKYDSDQHPLASRVYVDDQLFSETRDTVINTRQLEPGIHLIHVSAVYADGESRWVGPVEVMVRGALLTVEDPLLYSIFEKSLGYGPTDTQVLQLFEGDLSRITALVIDQPVKSLEGLGWCSHLKKLVVNSFPEIELDASPLAGLASLRILEWNERPMVHPESLGSLKQLMTLKIRKTAIESLDFLANINNLMSFEYSDAPIGSVQTLPKVPFLSELVLKNTGLTSAGFVSRIPELITLDLSNNQITETSYLSSLPHLYRADLSGNRISTLMLTDHLQSLHDLDASDNEISQVVLTEELTSLTSLDLSDNHLISPGRLLLYTPALVSLNLSHNHLRNMGKQRCQNLEVLDVTDNDLIATDWVSLQPSLKRLNLEHNRISDLSGLVKNNLYQQMRFLGLDKNPISKESFQEWLPLLITEIDSVSRPLRYQPLSPCYLTPSGGNRPSGSGIEVQWTADDSEQKCVYDLFVTQGDSLVKLLSGLQSCKAVLDERPAGLFSWVVASRTADTVFYSGVYDVITTASVPLPFEEGFESYHDGESLASQTDVWSVTGNDLETNHTATISSTTAQTGSNSLELTDEATSTLFLTPVDLPYVTIRFAAWIPPGQHGVFRIDNMNGMYIRLVWDESNIGRLYINDLLYKTFDVDHQEWMSYEIQAHARNNNLYVKAGQQLLMNRTWPVPEKVICLEDIGFSSQLDEGVSSDSANTIYFDDIKIITKISSGTDDGGLGSAIPVTVYPNPFTDYVNVTIAEQGTYCLSIIDISGRIVYQKRIQAGSGSMVTLPLSGLPAGFYTLDTGIAGQRPVRMIRTGSVY